MVAGRRRKKVPSKKIIAPLFLLSKRKRAVNGVKDFFLNPLQATEGNWPTIFKLLQGKKMVGITSRMKKFTWAEYDMRKGGRLRCYFCFRSSLGWKFSRDPKTGRKFGGPGAPKSSRGPQFFQGGPQRGGPQLFRGAPGFWL